MTSQPLLHVDRFSYARGGRILFNELSFTLERGEVVVLMGPNGSGKTTLLRCIAGIPESQLRIIKSVDISQGYVGHLNALKNNLTAHQNLARQTISTSQQVSAVFKSQKIAPLEHKHIRMLSEGQRRQVALARLPLSNAQLWLIDEPTTHLDEKATSNFWKMLKDHLKAGGGAVLTSHSAVPIPQAKIVSLHG